MSKLLATVAFVLFATFSVTAQTMPVKICDGKVSVNVTDMEPTADGTLLHTCYDITVSPDAIEGCRSLIITPVVKNSEGKKVLQIIVVNGSSKTGDPKWLDRQLRDACDPNYISYYTMKDGEYLTVKTCCSGVPFECWMYDNAVLEVTVQQATYKPNCIKALCGATYICDVPYLKNPLRIDPVMADAIPETVFSPDLHSIRTKVYYPVNVTKSVESYLENAEALTLLKTFDQPNFEVANIAIEGWASPEAKVKYNQTLSEKRAATVKKVISEKYSFPDEIYQTAGNGEYWDLVIDYVNSTDEAVVADNRDKIKEAIESNSDLDKREAAIRRIAGGKPYKAIFNATYPRSRFADCEIFFRFIRIEREDAMVIYNADPSKLTANDYAVLLTERYNRKIMDKALELYPNDERLFAIAGTAEYNLGHYDDAIAFYKKAGKSEEVQNNIACCYLMKSDYDNAKAYIEKASDLTIYDAQINELRKVGYNNKYFGTKK